MYLDGTRYINLPERSGENAGDFTISLTAGWHYIRHALVPVGLHEVSLLFPLIPLCVRTAASIITKLGGA